MILFNVFGDWTRYLFDWIVYNSQSLHFLQPKQRNIKQHFLSCEKPQKGWNTRSFEQSFQTSSINCTNPKNPNKKQKKIDPIVKVVHLLRKPNKALRQKLQPSGKKVKVHSLFDPPPKSCLVKKETTSSEVTNPSPSILLLQDRYREGTKAITKRMC